MTRTIDQHRLSAAAEVRYYAQAAVMVAISTLVGLVIAPRWGNSAVDLLFLPAVLGAALIGGMQPALFTALASALAYNFFFTAPYRTFHIDSPADVVTVVVLFLVAIVASHLAASVRKQARIAAAHAARNATIAGLARRLLSSTSEQDVAQVAASEIARLFDCNAVLVAGNPRPEVVASAPPSNSLTYRDIAAAALTLETGQSAGRAVSRVDPAEWQFHAVHSETQVLAAVGLARDDGAPPVNPDQLSLLHNLVDQIALALARAKLEREAREFAALRERDRLRSALLASIGQDVTPRLDEISKTVAELRRGGSSDKALVMAIGAEVVKLDRYIANLVDLGQDADQAPVEAGDIAIDLFQRVVSKEGQPVHLTPKEFAVLAELAKHAGRVLSHAHLLRAVWGPAQESQTEYLRVAVRTLRQKLERDPSRPTIIINEPAVGYRLRMN